MIKTLKNKQGVSLLIVVMYFIVISLLLGALFFVSMGNFKNQNTSSSHTSAFYVAESGINLTLSQIEEEIETLRNESGMNATNFYSRLDSFIATSFPGPVDINTFSTDIGDANANILIEKSLDLTGVYTITSYGTVDDVTRGLKRVVLFQYGLSGAGFTSDKAILSIGAINIANKGEVSSLDKITISADIASYCVGGSISLDGQSNVYGDIYVPPGTCSVVGAKDINTVYRDLETPELPEITFEFDE